MVNRNIVFLFSEKITKRNESLVFSKRIKNRRLISGILTGAMIMASAYGVSGYMPCTINTVQAEGKNTDSSNNDNSSSDELTEAKNKKSDAAQKKKDAEAKLSRLESEKEDIMELIEELDGEITGYEEKISELKVGAPQEKLYTCALRSY